jgi:uncharacterized protein YjbI with pentapeptide repeats
MGKLITREELDVILERHKKWLKGQKGGRKANLKGAILRELRLTNICLSWADLTGADLSGADLTNANLVGADLTNASLVGADLTVVDLSYANLDNTDLSYADLSHADFSYANLHGANLYESKLRIASFFRANLAMTKLEYADLTDADFEHSNLEPAILSSSEEIRRGIYLKKPMTGYKKCPGDIIVTLEIPEHAIVFSINNSKCRTNVAKVIDIDNGLRHLEQAASQYDRKFIYRKGEMVYPDEFDCRYNVECGGGIHFFRTREEAEEYSD